MNLDLASWSCRLEAFVWDASHQGAAGWRGALLRPARLVWALTRDVAGGQISLRAMGLVYTTLLSLVPLLAVSFSVLKAFGVHNQIEPTLRNLFAALGEEGEVVAERIVGFIGNVNVGVLGAAGLLFLVYTVVSLMQKIEEAFNYIWHVPNARSMGERFSRYLSVLLIGPLLVFSALGITASVMNNEVVARLLASPYLSWMAILAAKIAPYFMVAAAFTFIYLFIPNTRVRVLPALIAGVTGGVLWQSAGWAFAAFVAESSNYEKIYASFAVLLLFMIWLYVSWFILLFGADVGFYVQHPQYLLAKRGEPRMSNRMREAIGLAVMSFIAARHRAGDPAPTAPLLSSELGVPMPAIERITTVLEVAGLITATRGNPPAYLPTRDVDLLPVSVV
ncbi:MAG TPA: YhjD/YihY/BrkB family envelope integrity protein, partial [Burkholderiaceae bacterium]|nr:YhjD/YihY/BrkB family envelope integrity protein [Burkholderiaceae bacterium]